MRFFEALNFVFLSVFHLATDFSLLEAAESKRVESGTLASVAALCMTSILKAAAV